jgi:hypothetical protein
MPLGHLIALISNAHLRKRNVTRALRHELHPAPSRLASIAIRKTSLHRDRPNEACGLASLDPSRTEALLSGAVAPLCLAWYVWTTRTDVRRLRHIPSSRCQDHAGLVPANSGFLRLDLLHAGLRGSGGARRDRTDDLLLAKQALSQLSYGPRVDLTATFQATILRKIQPPSIWWAWKDLNFRPHAYQARALTN